MRDKDKVEVIIPQERHEELLKREDAYFKLLDSKSIILGYKYLDLKSPRNILMDEKDNLELIYHTGEGVPEEFIHHTNAIKEQILERLYDLNEIRLAKIEGAKEYFKQEMEWRKEIGMKPSWDLLEWLGLRKERDAR